VAQAFADMFDMMARRLDAQHGERLAIPASSLALAIQSLTMGLVYQAIVSPDAVSEDKVFDSFAALARGALREEVAP